MTMKKTDLEKHMAKKLDGRMKSAAVPPRFAQGSALPKDKAVPKPPGAAARLVAVSCRLPADLVNRLRERAVAREGGLNAVLAEAAEQWLAAASVRAAP